MTSTVILNRIADFKDLVMELDLLVQSNRAAFKAEPRIQQLIKEARREATTALEELEK